MNTDLRRLYRISPNSAIQCTDAAHLNPDGKPVIYWMSRDQRVFHNWSLSTAIDIARHHTVPICVVFTLVPGYPGATHRHYDFMLKGLQEIEEKLADLSIPFLILSTTEPAKALSDYAAALQAGLVITDFDPLRIKQQWQKDAAARLECPLWECDAHNIIPCRFVSQKVEFGAYTLRPRIHKLLPSFLVEFPSLLPSPAGLLEQPEPIQWETLKKSIKADQLPGPVADFQPGEQAAAEHLQGFLDKKLRSYTELRNDPNAGAVSDLSPWLHFGHISAQKIALQASNNYPAEQTASFLEELIVRRELSDNFCLYNPHYDSFQGFPAWAKLTLDAHRSDKRDYLYSKEQFEFAHTHDPLWNAAQNQMIVHGKMHGYMRMYWAKKILEWTNCPEEALEIAIYLNDRYELDGRDPNGYAGIAWSIGGVHDRAWFERPVYGKIRYMNANGCRSKFNTDQYIRKYKPNPAQQQGLF
jgi:deoxyribodipyrimidine photo-lyase